MPAPEKNSKSEEQLRAEFEAAYEAERRRRRVEPRARSAWYDRESGRIVIELRNDCTFTFPAEMGQGLRGATPEQLAEIEVSPDGYGLRWESLDADLAVPPLLDGIFGTEAWMSQWGKIGGSARSEAKAAAARRNGAKGGRPRKRPVEAEEERRKKAS
ncbi:MAG TPA: DUF2442 domain-containing protein [Longimicrobium sp.]|nr:DUF2442 domain-containing protein [Longimicrobium sp.]